ncbi:1-(5-phosphoribosyl)-5-((5-phosphoribosylamino)methylideneamino) imidazole-4-carboxamide isomerase [Candidatus Magnetomoraceae bacterium gMMP-1]
MIIIPAVDIKNGQCVRLLQGREDSETVFSKDPAEMALKWEKLGAEWLHVVDLDGAFQKSPQNLDAIKNILKSVSIPVQVGGGIRNIKTIESFLNLGIKRIILGTEAIRNPEMVIEAGRLFPNQIIVGIDARSGFVSIEGWTETTKIKAVDLAKKFEDKGIAAINFTDIYRDGMQTGPNIEETKRMAKAVSIPIVASGGVSTIDDIRNLLPLESAGVTGVITGRALYEGTLELKEALELTSNS